MNHLCLHIHTCIHIHPYILSTLVFEDSDISYYFMANFAKDQDEWMRLLNMAG